MDEIEEKKICVMSTRTGDMISNLPDCIIHNILSFLDTKFVVQTCILSKRWKKVWTSMPYLKFTFNVKKFVELDEYHTESYRKKRCDQRRFIENVLKGRDGSDVKKFVFQSNMSWSPTLIISVLCYLVRHNVQEIEIVPESTPTKYIIQFLECLDGSETLKKLKLLTPFSGEMALSKTLGFKALKELRLQGFSFSSGHVCKEMFPGCPVLEVLIFINCYFGSKGATISAPRLKKLEILYPPNARCNYNKHQKISVSAPLLSFFKYEGAEPMKVAVHANYMDSLEEVDIDVQADLSEIRDYMRYETPLWRWMKEEVAEIIRSKKEERIEMLREMLREFRNAKSVIISLKTLEVLSDIPGFLEGKASPFSNLKNLKLKGLPAFLPGCNFLLKDSPDVRTSVLGSFSRLRSGSCNCNCKS